MNSSSAGSDLSSTRKMSRHVSIHVPTTDEVVHLTDSVKARKRSPAALNHAHSIGALPNNSSTTSRPKSQTAAGRPNDVFILPGESNRSRLKNSKLASSMPSRLEKEHRKSQTVCDNSLLDKSSSSAVDSSAGSNTVLSRVSRKTTATVFSRSDINKTLMSEVNGGRMSKDLAKLVIRLSMSKEESELLRLPKTEASELRSWILASDSGCSKLPLSIQNHLNYMIQISDSERSTINNSRNININNIGYNRNVQVPSQFYDVSDDDADSCKLPFGRGTLKSKLAHAKGQQLQADSCYSASRKIKDLANKIEQRKFDDEDDIRRRATRKRPGLASRSYVTESVASDDDETDTQHVLSHHQSTDSTAFRETSTRPTARRVNNESSFEKEEAHSVIKKINRTLQLRRMLRKSSFLKTYESPSLRNSTSKLRTGLKQLQRSASSSTTGDDAVTRSNMTKLLSNQNFSVRSHLRSVAKQAAKKSLGPEFQSSDPDRSSLVRKKGSDSSLRSRGFLAKRQVASKKATSACSPRKYSRDTHSLSISARMQNSATVGLPPVLDPAAHRSLNDNSNKTGRNLTYGKVRQDANVSKYPESSRKSKPSASLIPNVSNTKAAAGCKGVSRSCKPSEKPSPLVVHGSKISGRWSDLGNWNGKVYTIKRVTSKAKMSAPKSVADKQQKKNLPVADKQRKKNSSVTDKQQKQNPQLARKLVGSVGTNKRTRKEQSYQQASDKSSVETVISCTTSKPEPNVDRATSRSSCKKPSSNVTLRSTTDRSDSKDISLKRHVKKPSLSDSVSKSTELRSKTSTKREASQKRTVKTPKVAASPSVKSESQSSTLLDNESAVSDVDEKNCSTSEKKRPEVDEQQVRNLSDTESAVSHSTFLAENAWHFGAPPQSWLGSWSLSAANGSRSSLNTETDKEEDVHSDETLLAEADDRRSCRLTSVLTALSFDRAVSTDSDPELNTTMLQNENHRDESPSNRHNAEPAPAVNTSSTSVSLRNCAIASHNDQHLDQRSTLIADRDDIFNNELEDIQLEPFPSDLFSVSSLSVAADVESINDDYKSAVDDESMTSLNSRRVHVSNNNLSLAENEVTAVQSVKQNSDKTGTEDWNVLQQECEITKSGSKINEAESEKHLNDTVNNCMYATVCCTSNSSPLLSKEQEPDSGEQSDKCPDIVRVFSSKSLTGRNRSSVISDSGGNTPLSQSVRFRSIHNVSAASASLQHEESSPAVSDESMVSLESGKICASNDSSTSTENRVKNNPSVNQDAEKTGTEDWKVLQQECEITKSGCKVNEAQSGKHLNLTKQGCEVFSAESGSQVNDNVNNWVCSSSNSPLSSSEQESDSREQSDKCPGIARVFSSKNLTGRVRSAVVSDSSSSTSLSQSVRLRSMHNISAACAGSLHVKSLPASSSDESEKQQQKNLSRDIGSRESLLLQSQGRDSGSKSNIKTASLASILKSNDNRAKTVDSSCRKQAPKPRTDSERFVNRVTLVNAQCNQQKHVNDVSGRQRNLTVPGEQMTLMSSQSDTSYEVLSSSVSSSDHKQPVTIVGDHQKPPPAKVADRELSESSSSIDYESLKAVVRNIIRNSNDDLERPAAAKVGHSVRESSNNDTRQSNSGSNTSCRSLQKPVKTTNRASDQKESKLSFKGELRGCHKLSKTTCSSSHVHEPDTLAAGSPVHGNADPKEWSISDTCLPEIGQQDHIACDMPSSSDVSSTPTEPASTDSADKSHCHPQCPSTSSGTSTGRADSMPYCDAICCGELELDRQECAVNESERTTGCDRCSDDIPNEVSDEFMTGFNEVERSVRQGSCRSVGELPAKSRRIATCHIPAPGIFTRQSVPALKYDEKRNCRAFVSASGYRKISDIHKDYDAEENTRRNPYDMRDHPISSPENDICSRFRDAATADSAYSCESASPPRRYSLTDVRQRKSRVKVNCKSSYAVKSRRQCKRRRRAAPVKSSVETESSETEGDSMCLSYTLQNFDEILQSVNSCQEVKRISCSQLYRMSRAGQSLAQRSPSSDCSTEYDTCDTSTSSADAALQADGATTSPVANPTNISGGVKVPDYVLPGDQDIQRNNESIAVPLHRGKDDVHSAGVLPSSKGVNPDDQTKTADLLTQMTTETLPKELSTDVIASDRGSDPVDLISSECGRELRNTDAKTKLVGNDECRAGNSNMRPTAPSSYEYTNNTASSPSTSFTLESTSAISDAFLEVLSSRLMHVMAKKQHEDQSSGFVGLDVETAGDKATLASKCTTTGMAAGSAAVHPDVVKPTAMNSYSAAAPQMNLQSGPFDCSVYDKLAPVSAHHVAGTPHGIEGYLQRSEADADCSEWTRPPDGAEFLYAKQVWDELQTTGSRATTGHEVVI